MESNWLLCEEQAVLEGQVAFAVWRSSLPHALAANFFLIFSEYFWGSHVYFFSFACVSMLVRWRTEYQERPPPIGWTSITVFTASASSFWDKRSTTSWRTRSSVFCW